MLILFRACGLIAGVVVPFGATRTAGAGTTGAHAHAHAHAYADALCVFAEALVAMRQWTFLLGPGLIPRINALFLGYLMYRSRLVPRLIPAIGPVGAPLILASTTGTIFGAWDHSTMGAAGGPADHVGLRPRVPGALPDGTISVTSWSGTVHGEPP